MNSLLITGEMRSGTTFVANLLNSQQQSMVYADMLISLFREAQLLGIQDIDQPMQSREVNVLLSNLLQEGKLQKIDFSVIDRRVIESWYHMFSMAMEVLSGLGKNIELVGVKKTREEAYLQPLLEKGMKVIYCVRDPRDVLLSAKNRFSEYNLYQAASNWKQSVEVAQSFSDNSNFMLLKYEDLILDKDKQADRLSRFLGIRVKTDFKELQLGQDNHYSHNSSFGDIRTLFDSKGVFRWQNAPISEEIALCDFVMQDEIDSFGYPINANRNLASSKRIARKYHSFHRWKKMKMRIKQGFVVFR